MNLAQLQRELAALLLEEPARRAFAKAPKRYAAARLRGKEARLLASLDPDDVGYFASRRQIDRRAMQRADLPRTTAMLEATGTLLRYFRAHPYALEDPLKETARVARWARQAAKKGQVPGLLADLARYEAAHLALRAAPHRAPPASPRPKRGRGVVLLTLGHDLEQVLEDDAPFEAPRRRSQVVLYQTPEGVVGGEVEPVAWHLLRAADGRRTEAQVVALAAHRAGVPKAKAREVLDEVRREGVLAPRPRRPGRRGADGARAGPPRDAGF